MFVFIFSIPGRDVLVGEVRPRVGGGGHISGASSTHRGGAGGADIYDGAVSVTGRDHVINRVIAGAVFDDQAASPIDAKTAGVGDYVVPFDPIIAVGGMDARKIKPATIFQDKAIGRYSYPISKVVIGRAVPNGGIGQ